MYIEYISYICLTVMKSDETILNMIVPKTLKAAFEKAVGKKYMSYHLRKEMERVVKKSNKIHHA